MFDRLLCVEDFVPHVGTSFVIEEGDGESDATLFEATPMGVHGHPNQRAPFSLLFRTSDRRILEQRLYRLRHGMMGELNIFLVPIAQDGDGTVYEAAFN